MKSSGITTKDKEEFLKSEREWFPSMSRKEYDAYMIDDVEGCKFCGTMYWKGCEKRCNCK